MKVTVVYHDLKKKIDDIFVNKLNYDRYVKTKEAIKKRNFHLFKNNKKYKQSFIVGRLFRNPLIVPSPKDIDTVLNNEEYRSKLDKKDIKFLEWLRDTFASETAYTTYMRMRMENGKIGAIRTVIGISTDIIDKITNGTFDLTKDESIKAFDAIIYHEAMHQYWGHLDVKLNMNPMLANILEDLVINSDGLNMLTEEFKSLKEKIGGIFPDTHIFDLDPTFGLMLEKSYRENKKQIDGIIDSEIGKWYKDLELAIEKGLKDSKLLETVKDIYDRNIINSDNKLIGVFNLLWEMADIYSKGEADGLLYHIENLIYKIDKILKFAGGGKDKDFNPQRGKGKGGGGSGSGEPLEKGKIGKDNNGVFDKNDIPEDVMEENPEIFNEEKDENELNRDINNENESVRNRTNSALKDLDKDKFEKNYRGIGSLDSYEKVTMADSMEILINNIYSKLTENYVGDGIKWIKVESEEPILYGQRRVEFEEALKRGQSAVVRRGMYYYHEIPIIDNFLFIMLDTSGSMSREELGLINSILCSLIGRNVLPSIITQWDYDYKRSIFINPLKYIDMDNSILKKDEFNSNEIPEISKFIDEIKEKLGNVYGRGGTGNFEKYIGTIFNIEGYKHSKFEKDLKDNFPQYKINSLDEFYRNYVDEGKVNLLIYTDSDVTVFLFNNDDFINKVKNILNKGNKIKFLTADKGLYRERNNIKKIFGKDNVDVIDLSEYLERYKKLINNNR